MIQPGYHSFKSKVNNAMQVEFWNNDNKPQGLFLVKGPFHQFFLGGGGYIQGVLYIPDKYMHFENAVSCSSNCNFLKFSAQNLSFYYFLFFTFLFLILYLQLSIPLTLQLQFYKKTIGYQIQCSVFGI